MSTGPTGIDGFQGPRGPTATGQIGPTGITGPQGAQPTPFGQRIYTAYSSTTPITLSYTDINTIVTIKYFPDISNTNLVVTLPSVGLTPLMPFTYGGAPWIIINYLVTAYSPRVSPVGGITFTQPTVYAGGTNTITTSGIIGQVILIYHTMAARWMMTINSNQASVRSSQGINQVDLAPLAYSGATAPTDLVASWAVATNLASNASMSLAFYTNASNTVVGSTTLTTVTPTFSGTGGTYTYTPVSLTAGNYYYSALFTPSASVPVYSNMSIMPGGLVTSVSMGTYGSSTFNTNLSSYPGAGYYLSCRFQINITSPVTVKYYEVNGSGTTLLSTSTFTAAAASGASYTPDSAASFSISGMTTGYYYYATVQSIGNSPVSASSTVCNLSTVTFNTPGYSFRGYQPGVYPQPTNINVYNWYATYNITISNVKCIKLVLLLWYNPNVYSVYHNLPNQQFYYYYRGGTINKTLSGSLLGNYTGTPTTSWLSTGQYGNSYEYGYPFGWRVDSYDYNDNIIATYNISGGLMPSFSILT